MIQNKIVPRVTDILKKDENVCRTYSNCEMCGIKKEQDFDLECCLDCGQILGRHPTWELATKAFQKKEIYRIRAASKNKK